MSKKNLTGAKKNYTPGQTIKKPDHDSKARQKNSRTVFGIFRTGADGSERLGQFSDHWTFNAAGKVTLRRTSLFTGADTIKA